jgi:hypothetical protein
MEVQVRGCSVWKRHSIPNLTPSPVKRFGPGMEDACPTWIRSVQFDISPHDFQPLGANEEPISNFQAYEEGDASEWPAASDTIPK